MKPFVVAAALGASCLAVLMPAAPAEAAPGGSYRESCRRIRDVGRPRDPVVQAQCLDTRKKWRDTTLAYRSCPNDVVNDNGRLACPGGGGRPGRPGWGGPGNGNGNGGGWGNGGGYDRPGPLPAGSWRRSCEPSEWAQGVLIARCENGNRGRETSRLDLRSCPSGRAANAYGRLVCE